jgi:NTE family protein
LALYYLEVVPENCTFRDFKGIREFGIVPSHISGTSAGAITGAFMQQLDTRDCQHIEKGRIFNFSNILIKRQGLFAMKDSTIFIRFFPHRYF